MGLCQYKNILGEPGKGVHSFRIFNFAIFDIVSTILLAYVIHKVFKIELITSLVICFLSGIILHRIFCVETTLDKILFNKLT